MFQNISIGQYFPGDSVIHKMDPRMKLVLTFAYVFGVFIPKDWAGLIASVIFVLVCVVISKIPIKMVLKSVRPIILVMGISSIINMLTIKNGNILFSRGFITITDLGVNTAIFVTVRIVCLVIGSSLLMYTTTPTSLTDGIERVLSPLNKLKLNVHELAMMMTIALRFIPTLIEETNKIMMAQKARGADIESGGVIQRIKALIPILIPLFISAFRRAFDLATAMECRCYHGGEGRTRMKQMHMSGRDYISFAVVGLFIAGLVLSRIYLPRVI